MGAIELVVDDEQPVGEQQEGVGQLGGVDVGGAAVGLALVAEVADETAVERERHVRSVGVKPRELAAEEGEQGLLGRRALRAARDGDLPVRDGVADLRAETAERRALEGEARQRGVDEAGVQPERGLAVAEQRGEGPLGVGAPSSTRWAICTAPMLRAGARPPGTTVLRGRPAPDAAGRRRPAVIVRKFAMSCAPCSVPIDSG